MRKIKCPACGAALQLRVEQAAPTVTVTREPEQLQAPAASVADRIRAAFMEARRARVGATVRELQRGPLRGASSDAVLSALEEMADAGEMRSTPAVDGRGRMVWRRVAAASENAG